MLYVALALTDRTLTSRPQQAEQGRAEILRNRNARRPNADSGQIALALAPFVSAQNAIMYFDGSCPN